MKFCLGMFTLRLLFGRPSGNHSQRGVMAVRVLFSLRCTFSFSTSALLLRPSTTLRSLKPSIFSRIFSARSKSWMASSYLPCFETSGFGTNSSFADAPRGKVARSSAPVFVTRYDVHKYKFEVAKKAREASDRHAFLVTDRSRHRCRMLCLAT